MGLPNCSVSLGIQRKGSLQSLWGAGEHKKVHQPLQGGVTKSRETWSALLWTDPCQRCAQRQRWSCKCVRTPICHLRPALTHLAVGTRQESRGVVLGDGNSTTSPSIASEQSADKAAHEANVRAACRIFEPTDIRVDVGWDG